MSLKVRQVVEITVDDGAPILLPLEIVEEAIRNREATKSFSKTKETVAFHIPPPKLYNPLAPLGSLGGCDPRAIFWSATGQVAQNEERGNVLDVSGSASPMFSFAPIAVPARSPVTAPVAAPVAVAAVAPAPVAAPIEAKSEAVGPSKPVDIEKEFPELPKTEHTGAQTTTAVAADKISKRKAKRDAKVKARAAKENTTATPVIQEQPKKPSFVQAATKIPSHPGEIVSAPKVKPQQTQTPPVQKPKYVNLGNGATLMAVKHNYKTKYPAKYFCRYLQKYYSNYLEDSGFGMITFKIFRDDPEHSVFMSVEDCKVVDKDDFAHIKCLLDEMCIFAEEKFRRAIQNRERPQILHSVFAKDPDNLINKLRASGAYKENKILGCTGTIFARDENPERTSHVFVQVRFPEGTNTQEIIKEVQTRIEQLLEETDKLNMEFYTFKTSEPQTLFDALMHDEEYTPKSLDHYESLHFKKLKDGVFITAHEVKIPYARLVKMLNRMCTEKLKK